MIICEVLADCDFLLLLMWTLARSPVKASSQPSSPVVHGPEGVVGRSVGASHGDLADAPRKLVAFNVGQGCMSLHFMFRSTAAMIHSFLALPEFSTHVSVLPHRRPS